MKPIAILFASFWIAAAAFAQSDPVIASVQQALKDQGFYYGDVTGKKDADTTAAIRRYQIRNGLQITGELNAETQKSLGIKGSAPAPPKPTPAPPQRLAPAPNTSDLREEPAHTPPPDSRQQPAPSYVPGPRGLTPEMSGVFDGTPYEVAPADLQRRVVTGAQTLLARRGYYRDVVDGEFGPATEFALRAFQSRFALAPTGRLDMDTLAALGLLPGQRAPGVTAPARRSYRRPPPVTIAPNGEPIYQPR
jgi:peptidoglycan hydrolase-like protein with peptidoglycan-binding domain